MPAHHRRVALGELRSDQQPSTVPAHCWSLCLLWQPGSCQTPFRSDVPLPGRACVDSRVLQVPHCHPLTLGSGRHLALPHAYLVLTCCVVLGSHMPWTALWPPWASWDLATGCQEHRALSPQWLWGYWGFFPRPLEAHERPTLWLLHTWRRPLAGQVWTQLPVCRRPRSPVYPVPSPSFPVASALQGCTDRLAPFFSYVENPRFCLCWQLVQAIQVTLARGPGVCALLS